MKMVVSGAAAVAVIALAGCSPREEAATETAATPKRAAETAPAAETAVWTDDIDAAFKTAAEKKKPVFIDFTGSDWCGWCKLAEKNIFSTKAWADFSAKVVCLKVDFPREGRPEAAVLKSREDLARKFNVEGFPTLVLADAGRGEIARFVAGRKDAAEFIAEVEKALKK